MRVHQRATRDAGAALVEYALMVALIAVVCLGAIQSIEDRGSDKLDDGAGDRGQPVEQLNIPANGGTIIGGGSGSTVGTGPASVHVFSLAPSSTSDPGTNWAMDVTIRVKNVDTPDLWSGVTVTGHWRYDEISSGGGPGGTVVTKDTVATCTTSDDGLCTVSLSNLSKSGNPRVLSVTFDTLVLSGPAGSGITYAPQSGDPTATSCAQPANNSTPGVCT